MNCEYHGDVRGPAADIVLLYANDEDVWIKDFRDAWKVATENSINFVQQVDDFEGGGYDTVLDHFAEHYQNYPRHDRKAIETLVNCEGIDYCKDSKIEDIANDLDIDMDTSMTFMDYVYATDEPKT